MNKVTAMANLNEAQRNLSNAKENSETYPLFSKSDFEDYATAEWIARGYDEYIQFATGLEQQLQLAQQKFEQAQLDVVRMTEQK